MTPIDDLTHIRHVTVPVESAAHPIPEQPNALTNTVSAHLVRLVLHGAAHAGVSPHEIAFISEFTPAALEDDLNRFPTVAQHRLWELVLGTGGPGVGLRVASLAEMGRLHVWDYLLSSAPTLAQGFTDAARYLATVADPVLVMNVAQDGPLVTVGYRGSPYSEAVDGQISEFALAILMRRACEARGAAAIPVRVGFAHRAPGRHGHLAEAFGTSNIQFDQEADTLTFLDPDRAAPEQPPDPELGRIMRLYAASIMDSARPVRTWIENFRGVLLATLADANVSSNVLDEVAQRLSMSSRTLQRRLAEHGTSGRAEIESIRYERAVQMLVDTQLPVNSIAGHLGYSDHRALGRAFRRWTGQTPDAYRKQRARV
ncbi:helix-turn-helix domain-containing protein [Nocardia jejuensis]|uniref:helix-turn-helix domain-containing protein n=1 Tax=Nocardia jejuensis TaxID=328049 RepID=UPI001470A2C8|nr:AraC family transcriptional regulator [Nocardia jejuensis]